MKITLTLTEEQILTLARGLLHRGDHLDTAITTAILRQIVGQAAILRGLITPETIAVLGQDYAIYQQRRIPKSKRLPRR